MSCKTPKATRKVVNWGAGPKAWCGQCKTWQPAEQVPWGLERRNAAGSITASYAALPHEQTA